MNWWFIAYIALQIGYLGYVSARHGETKTSEYDWIITLVAQIIMIGWMILMGIRL